MSKYFVIIIIGFTLALNSQVMKGEFPKRFYKDVYLQNLKMPKEKVSILKEDYISKVQKVLNKNFKISSIEDSIFFNIYNTKSYFEDRMYINRVNFNAFDEFKKIGVDITHYLFSDLRDPDEFTIDRYVELFFDSGIIFTATVIDSVHTKESYQGKFYDQDVTFCNYYVVYKLKVDKIIKGEYLFSNFPQDINLKVDLGHDVYSYDYELYLYERIKKIIKRFQDIQPINLIENEKILILKNINFDEKGIEKFLAGDITYHGVSLFYENEDKASSVYRYIKSFKEIINFMTKVEEINDTPNFYNRSYK